MYQMYQNQLPGSPIWASMQSVKQGWFFAKGSSRIFAAIPCNIYIKKSLTSKSQRVEYTSGVKKEQIIIMNDLLIIVSEQQIRVHFHASVRGNGSFDRFKLRSFGVILLGCRQVQLAHIQVFARANMNPHVFGTHISVFCPCGFRRWDSSKIDDMDIYNRRIYPY